MTEQEAYNLLVNVTGQLQMTRENHGRISEALHVIQQVLIDNEKRKEVSKQPLGKDD